jgi:heme ABC exporter ATP-binding subunit CcmA
MGLAVRFKSAVCLLGRFPALAGLDIEVSPGEVVLIEGPNGAGKSTLLRACAGLVPVVDGEAAVLGHDLRADRRSVRRSVGLLGPGGTLYDDLTVHEKIRFISRAVRGDSTAQSEALDAVALPTRLHDVAVSRLSAGQRRRVELAVLHVRRPRLWLLDEPHVGLDRTGRAVLDAMVRTAASGSAAVLLVSHEVETRVLADRVVTVVGGRVGPARQEPVSVA